MDLRVVKTGLLKRIIADDSQILPSWPVDRLLRIRTSSNINFRQIVAQQNESATLGNNFQVVYRAFCSQG
ncbi:hypothetical protein O9993_12110 [Vibrio lentus]|nr:hypothetical protein [Vibrio lentus]